MHVILKQFVLGLVLGLGMRLMPLQTFSKETWFIDCSCIYMKCCTLVGYIKKGLDVMQSHP